MTFNLEDKIRYEDLAPTLQNILTLSNTDLTQEISNRTTGDTRLQAQIDTIITQLSSLITKLNTLESDIDSLETAINNITTNNNNHIFAVNGYYKFESGFIIQWGTRYANDNAIGTGDRGMAYIQNFSIPFPHSCLGGLATVDYSGGDRFGQITSLTTTSCIVTAADKGEGAQNNTIHWLVWGF